MTPNITDQNGLSATNPLGAGASYWGETIASLLQRFAPTLSTQYTHLKQSLSDIGQSFTNPGKILRVQALMSEYESTLEGDSQIISSWTTMIKQMIQNIH